MRTLTLLFFNILAFSAFSQTFSGSIEFNERSEFFNSVLKQKVFYAKMKHLTNGEKMKSSNERDWALDGHVVNAVSLKIGTKFYSLDSTNKTVTEMYEDAPGITDQLKESEKASKGEGAMTKTNETDTILGIECTKYIKSQSFTGGPMDNYIVSEYFITTKYGKKFNFKDDAVFMNGYGMVLKLVTKSYESKKMKKKISTSESVATAIKEMPVDEKEFVLPEGWPVRSYNVTRFLKNATYTKKE
jgi:hypothetical protein